MKKNKLAILLPTLGACLLTLTVFLFLWLADRPAEATLAEDGENLKTVLLAGVDDVGENTDALMLCSMNKSTGVVKLLQIPRDTYYRTENGAGKINRIFRCFVSKYGRKNAAEKLCAEIEEALSVPLDGYVIFDTRTLGELTELIGGVTVDVPTEIPYLDAKTGAERRIPAGRRTLMGEEAVAFVRYRKGYTEGDLGRLDAQMRFLGGVANALPRLKKADRILTIYKKILPNLLTNLGEKDIMEIMMVYLKKRGAPSVLMMRLPGEACYTDGRWYYVLHRRAAENMLVSELGGKTELDGAGRFTDPVNETVRNIYTVKDATYRVYTVDEAAAKRILHT